MSTMPLYWRVCLINGAVFVVGAVLLVLSPATVSARVLASEAVVVAVGLAAILIINALLLRAVLVPLDQLAALMPKIDLLSPGQRLPLHGSGAVSGLITSFNDMLARLETERSASTGRALQAQESERQRIGHELHDEVGQSLTVVLLELKRAVDDAPPELADQLRRVQETTRASLEEVRRIASRLRPGLLEDLGLLSALSALANDFAGYSGVSVRRGFGPALPALSRDAELVVYRVTQEALTNVARHARASNVDLSLTRQGDRVALRVADDGLGLHGPAAAGIQGMRERAMLVGAELIIGARVGGGTEVRLVVPARDREAPPS